jgi:hypothetical protein
VTEVATEHVDVPYEEGMPDKGRALVRETEWSPGKPGPHLWFRCPRDRLYCGVPLKPSPPNSKGFSWDWDGNRENPTVSPSINCCNGGCGWHGFINNGEVA